MPSVRMHTTVQVADVKCNRRACGPVNFAALTLWFLPSGANTIYLHDHRSEPPLRELLTDYIDAGIVHYTWWNRSWDNWNYTQDENPQMVSKARISLSRFSKVPRL